MHTLINDAHNQMLPTTGKLQLLANPIKYKISVRGRKQTYSQKPPWLVCMQKGFSLKKWQIFILKIPQTHLLENANQGGF